MLHRLTGLLILIGALVFGGAATAQDVIQRPIAGFPHAVLHTVGDQPKPVVVILHGADGNDEASTRFGPILARMGYAAVGLPYYSPNWGDYGPPPKFPDLPGSFIDIRVDQIADLREALRGMPGADVERFGLFGASKGAEFALIAGSRYPWIDSIVAYAPTDVVWEGWGLEMVEAEGTRSSFSFGGQPLPFMPYRGFVEGLLAGPAADLRAIHANGRLDHPDREAAARIPVEAYRGDLLLIAGGRDAQWDAASAATAIQNSRTQAGLETTALIYPEAGHDLVGDGGVRQVERSGGSPEADAAARQDAWPRVVAFMARTLAN
ncbi:MAG: acyl-CoA thioester hydrolase/BAAT C-terminal domain-containing protein [Brevundimonas sp.]|nr:acyl-CoA thioester hydrolase/BAAT C-terminal domain-containing protein [Brevundimonas sp.]